MDQELIAQTVEGVGSWNIRKAIGVSKWFFGIAKTGTFMGDLVWESIIPSLTIAEISGLEFDSGL